MIGDRHYMRDESHSLRRSPTFILTIVLTVVFALQQIDAAYVHSGVLSWLVLSPSGLAHGYLWQLVTFQFLHGGLTHLLCNLVGLWFLGRFMEERLGTANMLKIYLLGGVIGGLLQATLGIVFPNALGRSVVGASAGVCALLSAFCTMEPEQTVFFNLLIPIKARFFLWFALGIAVFFTLVPSDPTMAHAAHLGGLLLGIASIRWNLLAVDPLAAFRRLRTSRPKPEFVKATASGKAQWAKAEPVASKDDLPPAEFISREVDPILDKISAHGIQSLTPRERRILEQARAKMSRRL